MCEIVDGISVDGFHRVFGSGFKDYGRPKTYIKLVKHNFMKFDNTNTAICKIASCFLIRNYQLGHRLLFTWLQIDTFGVSISTCMQRDGT